MNMEIITFTKVVQLLQELSHFIKIKMTGKCIYLIMMMMIMTIKSPRILVMIILWINMIQCKKMKMNRLIMMSTLINTKNMIKDKKIRKNLRIRILLKNLSKSTKLKAIAMRRKNNESKFKKIIRKCKKFKRNRNLRLEIWKKQITVINKIKKKL